MSQEKLVKPGHRLRSQNPGLRYSTADNDLLERWERDRYLIDRRKILKFIYCERKIVSFYDIFSGTNASVNNVAMVISQLEFMGIIEFCGKNELRVTGRGRLFIFLKRRDFFHPKLERVWDEIPSDTVVNDAGLPVKFSELPSNYRRL